MRPMGTKNILKFRIDKVHIVLQWGIMLFIVFCSSKNAKIITCQYSFMLIQTYNIYTNWLAQLIFGSIYAIIYTCLRNTVINFY